MRATMAEQIAIHEKLREVCKTVEGLCVYAQDWDDAAVAKEVAPRLTANHVAYVRKQMGIGKLVAPKEQTTKDIEELQHFIVEVMQGYSRVTKQLTDLAARVSALEQTNVVPLEARRL
jgi:uncharacterized coiled-coil protein SlyX